MKRFKIFTLLLSLSFLANAQTEKQKIALLIGVGDYAENTNWTDLQSANDIELIKGTLLKKGFAEADILTLADSAATFSGIKAALQYFESRVEKNGIAYFHFSGHGQQVWDDNGDEIDGLDEALVPHNSIEYYDEDIYVGDSLIRDDLLEAHFFSIRKKLGGVGHLLVTIDACHSGTATRGLTKSRGTSTIMASKEFLSKNQSGQKDKSRFEENREKLENAAPMVSLFSSGANQLSYELRAEEGFDYGIFTHAFCNQILASKPTDTYESVFANIKRAVSHQTDKQIPQIEGASNAILFDGELQAELTYFSVRQMITNDLMVLNSGSLSGLRVGTEVIFFSKETIDTAGQKPIAKGIIDQVTPFDCDVRLAQMTDLNLEDARAFIHKKNYGSLKLNLQLNLNSPEEENRLKEALKGYSFLNISEESADLFLDKSLGFAGNASFEILSADETVLMKIENGTPEFIAQKLARTAAEYAQSRFLKTLELESWSMKPVARIHRQNTEGKFEVVSAKQADLETIKEGETVKIEIRNEGEVGFYFSVIDIMPNNKSSLIIPYGKPAADFFLEPNTNYFSDEFDVSSPFGTEVLKIIATAESLNLRKFIETRGNFQQVTNPLEVLLSETFFPDNLTRGQTTSVYAGDSAISSLIFEIVK